MMTNNGDPEDKALVGAILRFTGNILGLVFGTVGALVVFLATNWLVIKGGDRGGPHLSQFVARNTTRAPTVPKTRPRMFPLNRRIAPTRALSSGSPLFVIIAPLRTGIHRRGGRDSRGVARFTEGDPGLRGGQPGEVLRPAVLAS